MTINERVLSIIKENKKLTQKEMAKNIGFPYSTVNNWLKLGNPIPADAIIPISEFLGVSCDYLLGGEDRKENSGHSSEDQEWLSLIHALPAETQRDLLGALRMWPLLHASSVAAEESLKKASGK